jgi:hypothetical protein
MMHKKQNVYAVYKGDEFLDLGTAKELAERMGVKPATILFMTYPSYQKQLAKRKESYGKGYMIVIKIEEDLEDDYS